MIDGFCISDLANVFKIILNCSKPEGLKLKENSG
jgi:hypothetical protein